MKTVLSCIQPTGDLHLGNYFGAVQNWVRLQADYQCFYGVVDNHSMTMPYNPQQLRENTWRMAFQLLACGIDPKNIFIQSLVPEHTELCWTLSCVTSFGELSKMTQFKDKRDQIESNDNKAFVSTGLFFYPVLQAADILLYQADFVPVGKDQEQHLELSRNIAARFNHQFCSEEKPFFKHPEPLFTETPKLLSPADPTRKMSKSLGEKHYINLFAEPERIRKQIKSAVTDTGTEAEGEMSAGVQNLFELLRACGKMDEYNDFWAKYHDGIRRYGDMKAVVADAIIELTEPMRQNMREIQGNEAQIKAQIIESSARTRERAQKTMQAVREMVGLIQ